MVANPDVIASARAIDVLDLARRADARIGSAGPRIVNAEGTVYPSARKLPSLVSGAGHAVLSGRWSNNPWTRRYRDGATGSEQRDAGWLSGSFLLVLARPCDRSRAYEQLFITSDVTSPARAGWRTPTYRGDTHAHSTRRNPAAAMVSHHDSAYRYI